MPYLPQVIGRRMLRVYVVPPVPTLQHRIGEILVPVLFNGGIHASLVFLATSSCYLSI